MESADLDLLFKRKVHFLAQTYFIKDSQRELRLNAHKYDFDILFFDQMVDFLQSITVAGDDDIFVVDLDSLNSLQQTEQGTRKMFLGEMLEQLPPEHGYVYLETSRQGSRFHLQKTLVEGNCLAYAEKPISNESLVERLFNQFARQRRPDLGRVLALGESLPIDQALFAQHRIQLVEHPDIDTFHTQAKQYQPDLIIISDTFFRRMPVVPTIIRLNMETDPSLEIVLLQSAPDAALARQAIEDQLDDVIQVSDPTTVARQIVNRITKIRINKDLINKDRATGLLNKIGFKRKAQETIRRAEQIGKPLGMCIVDIDKFKTINDTWGHYFGDIVIKRLSLLLGAFVGEQDLLSRFGGEEFVMLYWDIDPEKLLIKLNKAREAFNAIPFEVEPGDIRHFSFSGGAAYYPILHTENELFLEADERLYDAKTSGRNRICG